MQFFWIVFVFCASSALRRRVRSWDTKDEHSTAAPTNNQRESDILGMPENGPQNSAKGNFSNKWPEGVVPIALSSSFDATEKKKIIDAVNEIVQKTCLTFRYKTEEDSDYIKFMKPKDDECSSHIGRIGGMQKINLHPNCLISRKSILHEIMHALGFLHEHNRFDRDDYITINYDNIEPNMKYNFRKQFEENLELPKTEYAYDSIMHYPHNHFSIDPKKSTIISKKPGITKFGGGENLSEIDVKRINMHYSCVSAPPTNLPSVRTTPTTTKGTRDPDPTPSQILTTTIPKIPFPSPIQNLSTSESPTTFEPDQLWTPKTPPKFIKIQRELEWTYNCKFSTVGSWENAHWPDDCIAKCAKRTTCDHFMWKQVLNYGYCSLLSGYDSNVTQTVRTNYPSRCGKIKSEKDQKWMFLERSNYRGVYRNSVKVSRTEETQIHQYYQLQHNANATNRNH